MFPDASTRKLQDRIKSTILVVKSKIPDKIINKISTQTEQDEIVQESDYSLEPFFQNDEVDLKEIAAYKLNRYETLLKQLQAAWDSEAENARRGDIEDMESMNKAMAENLIKIKEIREMLPCLNVEMKQALDRMEVLEREP